MVMPRRVLIDSNFLIAWKCRSASIGDRERAHRFADRLKAIDSRIIIPTPAIAEYLVKASTTVIADMHALSMDQAVVIGPFDYGAALSLHILDRAARSFGDKKDGIEAPWQKIKTDRQIVAIAHAQRCYLVVTGDQSVMTNALRAGIPCCPIDDLDLRAAPWRRHLSAKESRLAMRPSSAKEARGAASGATAQFQN